MAASVPWVPFPLGHQVPVTPPPDIQAFPLPQQPSPLSPHLLKSFAQELYGNSNLGSQKTAAFQAHLMMNQLTNQGGILSAAMGSVPSPPPWMKLDGADSSTATRTTAPSTRAASEAVTTMTSTTAPSITTQATTAVGDASTAATTVPSDAALPMDKTAANGISQQATDAATASANDPRYLAMASRIAAYYHQRCQAVANFQQQRCQAWANMQRQKSQEMTQAAMLVIAWYIRDRIQRRRRRQKRQFRRALATKARPAAVAKAGGSKAGDGRVASGVNGSGRITKGEAVRKWVLQIPDGHEATRSEGSGGGTTRQDGPLDPDEAVFDIDREVASDKDVRLYSVADNLIKSQLARIDVPLMGKLSFDASDTESEDYDDDDADDDDEFEEEEDEDEDYAMADYEERGAGPAAAVAAMDGMAVATITAATAARAGLGAGAQHDDNNDYVLGNDKDSDARLSAMVHHASSCPLEKSSYYS